METGFVELITSTDKNWNKRWKYNCAIFIISYIFMGAVTGITNDSYISYLNLTVPDVVKGLPMYASIGTFVLAMSLLLVHKLGYKKIIIFAPIVLIGALLSCIYSNNGNVILVANILVNIGAGLFDFIYPLMFTSYTPKENRISMFSRVMYCNLISQSILTFLGGKIVVWKFSKYLGLTYDKTSILSQNAENLSSSQLFYYIKSYKFVLWLAIIFTILALVCLFFLRERVEDYQETQEETLARKSEKKFDIKLFYNKYIIMWIVIFSIIRFGALLVTPYFPIYLNNFLHISRGTVSTIITAQTVAMVLGFLAASYLEKKLGSIISIATTMVLCIPLMLIMANGTIFGSNIVWVIGGVLFIRSGLANASNPIQQSLPLTFVSKNLAPAYSSFILISNSVVGIFAGIYARYFLLRTESGYGTAYYITSTLYFTAIVLLVVVYTKKYNRGLSEKEIKEHEVKEEFVEEI